jgi:hypothetical protein
LVLLLLILLVLLLLVFHLVMVSRGQRFQARCEGQRLGRERAPAAACGSDCQRRCRSQHQCHC